MTRENYKSKGVRYLAEARLTVRSITPTEVTATVRGTGDIHNVTATTDAWRCTCPAKGPCCHIHAAQLVTLKPARHRNCTPHETPRG